MANVSFTPTFQHTDYVDNRDRVQAGGPNGFNARFRALATDLGKLSAVVTDVDDELQQRPSAEPLVDQTVTIPALVAGPPQTGGSFDVLLGGLLPVTSHAFHFVSVRPAGVHLNAQVTWEEIAFAADAGANPMIARVLRLRHTRPVPITVSVRVLRLEMDS